MSSTIIIKNSATSGSIPASLVQGELGINVTNGRLFYGSGSAGTVKEFGVTSSYALQALTASYALNGGVTQLLAGPNITLAPINGLGQVTVSATLSGSTIFNTATGSYGSFYDTTTQTNPVGNIPRSMSLDTTDITNGVSISGSTNPFNTYIKTQNAGVYNIQFSAQIDKTDSGTDEIVIWLRKNGIDLTDTATTITLSGNNDKQVAAWNWFVTSAANDYYQIIWLSADTDLRLLAEPISGTHPGIPSVIVTANRVDQFLSNTGSFSGSFQGNGSGLTNIPASGITGLNLSQIATGSVSASVSPGTSSFQVTSGSTNFLFISSSGNIGIGTTTPTSAKLQVSGSTSALGLQGSGSGVFTVDGTSGRLFSVDDSLSGSLFSVNTAAGLPLIEAFSDNTVRIGQFGQRALFVSQSAVGIGVETLTAKLQVSGSNSDKLLLVGSPASSSILFVTGSGLVGIGTNNPSGTVDISGSLSSTQPYALRVNGIGYRDTAIVTVTNNNSTDGQPGLYYPSGLALLMPNLTSNRYMTGFSVGTALSSNNSAQLYWYSSTAGSASNYGALGIYGIGEIIVFNGSGNVGIGTTSPSFKLDVSGSTRITNGLTVTGSFTVTTGSLVEFQVTNTGVKIGNASTDVSTLTGSLQVAGQTRISGSFNTAISGTILTVIGSGSTQPIFTIQGSQGELFSVTDSLSGSLFSVNDISGLPILEVFSDSTTNIGNYLAPAVYTTNKITQTNSGSFVVYSLPTASYDGAFYDYTVRSGSNARAGQIMAIWSGSSVNFTETTTTSFGSTSAIGFTVIVSGSNMVLTGSSATGSWTIKTIIRSI